MTKEEQRIKILEFLGWTDLKRINFGCLRGTNPEGYKNSIAPNPLKNLHAIKQATKRLEYQERRVFVQNLCIICDRDFGNGEIEPSDIYDPVEMSAMFIIDAQTDQLCEAFLKTLNLWVE